MRMCKDVGIGWWGTNEVGGKKIRQCRRHNVIFDLASWKYCSTIFPDLIRVVPTLIPVFLMPPVKLKWQIWSTIWIHQCVSQFIREPTSNNLLHQWPTSPVSWPKSYIWTNYRDCSHHADILCTWVKGNTSLPIYKWFLGLSDIFWDH